MEPIVINGSPKKPSVDFNNVSGVIRIQGRSVPEDSVKFYRPLVDWIMEYKASPQELTEVHIQLDYFNTASSKCLTDVFKEIEEIYKAGNKVEFNWYYSDEYILEAGEDYQSFIQIPFKMIEVAE
jgi:hypothetical protein